MARHPTHPAEPVSPEEEQPDPNRVITVGEEQLKRSQEIEAMGVDAWKEAHDERKADERPQSVEGVTRTDL